MIDFINVFYLKLPFSVKIIKFFGFDDHLINKSREKPVSKLGKEETTTIGFGNSINSSNVKQILT